MFWRTFSRLVMALGKATPQYPPSLCFGRRDFLKIRLLRNLPDQSGPAVIRRDNEGVTFIASFTLEISNLPEGEASNYYIN
jgi:hypothetical protein